jgi:hypothetical protein
MTRWVKVAAGIGLAFGLSVPTSGQGPKESASVRVASRLQALLEPTSRVAGPSDVPVTWPAAKIVEKPRLPPTAYAGLPPQPPVPAGKQPMPRSVPEGQPPVAQGPKPIGVQLPTKPLVQLPAMDVEAPLPLPILARPNMDRASLDDATLEASQAAALERVRPRRMEPVPFAPVNLPDPFENIRTGGLRYPPGEIEQPPAVPVRTPAR